MIVIITTMTQAKVSSDYRPPLFEDIYRPSLKGWRCFLMICFKSSKSVSICLRRRKASELSPLTVLVTSFLKKPANAWREFHPLVMFLINTIINYTVTNIFFTRFKPCNDIGMVACCLTYLSARIGLYRKSS